MYSRYATLRPMNLQLWFDVGQLAERSNAWDEAVRTYQLALAEFPTQPLLHARLGNSLYQSRRGYDAALHEIRRAIALSPEGQFYASGGQILAAERQFTEADGWFARAIAVEPETPWWYVLRADSLLASGDLPAANDAYTQIMQRFPEFPQAYFQCAWVYRLTNRPDLAIRMIERALVLSNVPEPWYWVRAAEIYEWAGSPIQALRAYQAALAIDPTIDTAIQGLNRLTKRK